MSGELPHNRGRLAIQGVGWLGELESFEVNFQGDPEDLEAIEGTVGQLPPKGKRVEITGVLFVPDVEHVGSKILEYWDGFTRVGMIAEYGNKHIACKGRFNAPQIGDDGTRFNFTFKGANPKIRSL